MGRGKESHHSRKGDELNWKRKSSRIGSTLPGLVASGISKKMPGFFLLAASAPFLIISTTSPNSESIILFQCFSFCFLSPIWPRNNVHELNSGELSNLSNAYLEQAFVVVEIVVFP